MILIKKIIDVKSTEDIQILFGSLDKNRKYLQNRFNVKIALDNSDLYIQGDEITTNIVEQIIISLLKVIKDNKNLDFQTLKYHSDMLEKDNKENLKGYLETVIVTTNDQKPIRAKTLGQKNYVDMIMNNDIVFGIGPAGTGKTYLAMAMAIRAFKKGEVNRIILTRPAVEAGESLGFLPGDLQEKVDPYLRPLYDALFEILGFENYQNYVEKNLIEVAPLAYMRGRTLDNAYVILDEAQNTTHEQMKMFLTRIGYGSKAIITGDKTQLDLPRGKKSGLLSAINILKNVTGIGFMEFQSVDIVRHPLVQRIIDAYESFEMKNENLNKSRSKS